MNKTNNLIFNNKIINNLKLVIIKSLTNFFI